MTDMPNEALLAQLEEVARTVATEAARYVVDDRPDHLGVARTKSSATDVVTVMDQGAQDLIRARLHELRPDDAFLGEEEGGSAGDSGLTWVVDPIDGTVNYLYRIPSYAVSVAVVVGDPRVPGQWTPVAGAVANPVSGEVFHARRGGGAWLSASDGSQRRLAIESPPDLDHALVGTGFGYAVDRRRWQAAVLLDVLPQIRDIRRIGSAALDICAVADGHLDAYFERGLNPWDMAAAWLVLAEAGGTFTGLAGGPPDEWMVVAAAEPLHGQLEIVLRDAAEAAGEE
jgi:myo-inositol-1(or 4)-monophosphatase